MYSHITSCMRLNICRTPRINLSCFLVSVSTVEPQVILLDREIEGYKRSIAEEQEQNVTLTVQLNRSQMDGATSKKLISQMQAKQEALQAHYSTCVRTLRETESNLARLSEVHTCKQVAW